MTLIRILALSTLVVALQAAAQDKAPSWKDKLKDAAKGETSQNYKAQGLAKIGMDVTASPAGAKVYFISPQNGATVSSPVTVQFGLSGMGIAPAGVQKENVGHHHLIVDGETPSLTAPMPANDQITHFGGGQTEAIVKLKPGTHTLQLVLGDWKHQAHSPPVMSEKITITVK